jgi:hypothetical protein
MRLVRDYEGLLGHAGWAAHPDRRPPFLAPGGPATQPGLFSGDSHRALGGDLATGQDLR